MVANKYWFLTLLVDFSVHTYYLISYSFRDIGVKTNLPRCWLVSEQTRNFRTFNKLKSCLTWTKLLFVCIRYCLFKPIVSTKTSFRSSETNFAISCARDWEFSIGFGNRNGLMFMRQSLGTNGESAGYLNLEPLESIKTHVHSTPHLFVYLFG